MQSKIELPVTKLIAVATVFLVYSAPSYAYLDPGTGSIILQSILAGVAVAMGVLRIYWHRFKAFVSSLTGSSRSTGSDLQQGFEKDSEAQDEL